MMLQRNIISSDEAEKFMDQTLSGIGFLSLVENIFLFIILQRCKRLPLQIKLLMLSSTVSDSILGANCFLLHCRALTDIFVNKEMFCWIRQSIFWTTVIVSVFFMTLLSLDRCLSLTLVMRYQSKIDLFTTSIVLIVAWSLGLVFGVSRAADVQYNGQCTQTDGISTLHVRWCVCRLLQHHSDVLFCHLLHSITV